MPVSIMPGKLDELQKGLWHTCPCASLSNGSEYEATEEHFRFLKTFVGADNTCPSQFTPQNFSRPL